MSNPNCDEVLRQPGYLWWNPTALDAEENYGTRLGFAKKGVKFQPRFDVLSAPGMEYGNEPVIQIFAGMAGRIFAEIRNWNVTVLGRAFPGLISSNALQFPGSLYAGTRMDSDTYCKPLLFMPEAGGADNNIVLFQKARPGMADLAAAIFFANKENSTFPLVFDAIRADGSDIYRSIYVGPVSGAALV